MSALVREFLAVSERMGADMVAANYEVSWICEQYSQEGRHYHDLRHPEEMTRSFIRHRDEVIADVGQYGADTVLLGIAYHDVVMDRGGSPYNEVASARAAVTWARYAERLRGGLPWIAPYGLSTAVGSTADHLLPAVSHMAQRMAMWLIDFDLERLASPDFDQHTEDVREEYPVTDEEWRLGRAAFLDKMLQRKSIYLTDAFRQSCEFDARTNLLRSRDALRG